MTRFNKVYNFLMQDRADQFRPRLYKYKKQHPNFNPQQVLHQLLGLDSKQSKLALTLIVNGLITGINDKKWEMYKADILNTNVDVNNISQIEQALDLGGKQIKNNKIRQQYKNLEKKYDCLSNKQLLPNNVVIYDVADTRKAMMQIRQIVDAFVTDDRSVWCIVRRQNNGNMDQGWSNWIKYNAYPKQIAFQNEKVLGFNANQSIDMLWWDERDLTFKGGLRDLYGKPVHVKPVKPYSQQERDELTLRQFKEMDCKNGLYHTNGDVRIPNDLIVDGHIPIQFSYVGGNFYCKDCVDLKNLKGFPMIIKKDLDLTGCTNLVSLEGAPQRIGGEIKTKDIEGVPFYQLKQWVNSYKL